MPIPFRLIRFIWAYNGRVQRLITTMKYRPSRHLARFAGQELTRTLPTLNLNYDWDYIVPLPSAITSLRARLFNQCVLIANELKRTLEIPIALNALYHRGAAAPQASLALAARIPNVRNAFKVNKKLVETKRILLIDDVITSGATSTVAALSLLSAGASSVDLLALAQAESWQTQRYNIYRNLTEPALTKEGHINLSNSKVT